MHATARQAADIAIRAPGSSRLLQNLRSCGRGCVDVQVFADAGIKLTWFDYVGNPEYPATVGELEYRVTVLDLPFDCGPDSTEFLRFV
jgi:hypothetical protein